MQTITNQIKKSIFDTGKSQLFLSYKVSINLESIAGGMPVNQKIYVDHLMRKMDMAKKNKEAIINEIAMKFPDAPEKLANLEGTQLEQALYEYVGELSTEKTGVQFRKDEQGNPMIEGRHAKAMLKEVANILYSKDIWCKHKGKKKGFEGKDVGGKNPKNVIAETVFIDERYLPLWQDEGFTIPAEIKQGQQPVHIKNTYKGTTQTSIKEFEYAENAFVTFTIKVSETVHEEVKPYLDKILQYAQENGLGASRSQMFGRFSVYQMEKVK